MSSSPSSPPPPPPLPPSPTSPSPPSTTALSAIDQLTATLGSLYRISVTDGRTFIGNFQCIDAHGNIILSDALEFAPGPDGARRDVGLILIPIRHWVTIERDAKKSADEEKIRHAGSCLAV